MLLEVSLNTLKKARITAHQFLITRFLVDKRIGELIEYLKLSNSENNWESDLENLQKASYISYNKENPKDFLAIKVSPLFYKEISDGDFFEEIFMTFPVKVIRTNGVADFLRTEKTYCKNIYDSKVARNKSKHEHILMCLKKELEIRKQDNSFKYIKRLSNWLATDEWKSYEGRLDESTRVQSGETNGYGIDLE